MREWDEMVARQVQADGVRTTWGEHIAPPGGEVTVTDDRILSAEEWNDNLTAAMIPALYDDDVRAGAGRFLRNHDAALRAALAAAELRANDDAYAHVAEMLEAARADLTAAEERAEQAEHDHGNLNADRIRAEAERDQAIRERDAYRANSVKWEAQVAALTEALREERRLYVSHRDDLLRSEGSVHVVRNLENRIARLDAALGEKNDGTTDE